MNGYEHIEVQAAGGTEDRSAPWLFDTSPGISPGTFHTFNDHYYPRYKWPGRVALVVGGSADIKQVYRGVKKQTDYMKVRIITYHSELLMDGHDHRHELPEHFLLLITESLFSQDWSSIRYRLDKIFDTCEVHRMQSGPLHGFGLCDILTILQITYLERDKRSSAVADGRYVPIQRSLPTHQEEEWTREYKWRRFQHPFMGFKLPDMRPDPKRLSSLLEGWRRAQLRDWRPKEAYVSFNSIPLGNLLIDSLSVDIGPVRKLTLILYVCAVQLVSSSAFSGLFQAERHLLRAKDRVWKLTETTCLLNIFLTSRGQTSLEVGIVFLCLQTFAGDHNKDSRHLRNTEGRTLDDLSNNSLDVNIFREILQRVGAVLQEVITVTREFAEQTLSYLQQWPWKPQPHYVLTWYDASWVRPPPAQDMIEFLQRHIVAATTEITQHVPPEGRHLEDGIDDSPTGFSFPINTRAGEGFYVGASPLVERHQDDYPQAVQLNTWTVEMLEDIAYYGCRHKPLQDEAIFEQDGAVAGDDYLLLFGVLMHEQMMAYDRTWRLQRQALGDVGGGGEEQHNYEGGRREDRVEWYGRNDLDVIASGLPVWAFNGRVNPVHTGTAMRLYSCKRHAMPDRVFLDAPLLAPAPRLPDGEHV
eukprot:TRINITY_DN33989_c0_g1_i1.p1 TRINITY_DN33989_c0_g1~~TRINITY_DN33989_c0_g1_i1.p1  ORF type:complete len:641 (-),score=77.47 TRINITY_DN33989_c0_g1_i1:17-1939(-)